MSEQHRIVSSESEELILVNEDDEVVGYRSKADSHDGDGLLHRAFSLFLFNEAGELLLQQRSEGKRLWPGFWSNSCCSHPRRGETLEIAVHRRLLDELNVAADLEYVYRFCYEARYGEQGSENELCHVFLGRLLGDVRPNDSEVQALRFVSRSQLDAEFARDGSRFTPWFHQEWQALNDQYASALARYAI